jgi:hypothetical protein
MPFRDDLPIKTTTDNSTRALCPQRRQLLWADLNGHVTASHLFESLGERDLVAKHLQAATRLLLEIHS